MALKDHTEILYKTNNFYSKECERSIKWDAG
ncbi:dTDP-4-dehydrorhamnose 3,5-epimerase family protein [Cronobacter malonaticus]|nr:dTDP-4-dehydrorhamnose 3,5-epimerase family protein [Cronobacter malonaticus]